MGSDDRNEDTPFPDKADEVADRLLHRHDRPADVLVPDGIPLAEALQRTTVLGIGAHPDDLEIGMTAAILSCVGRTDRWFTGVTCTDGGGSPQLGPAILEPAELVDVRRHEQRVAARVGGYGAQIQFGYPTAFVRGRVGRDTLAHRLAALIEVCRPEAVFTHSLADRHTTHVGVTLAVIDACRVISDERRPRHIIGVEIWGSLDWLAPEDRVVLPVDDPTDVAPLLIESFTSQVATKPYAKATRGRWIANATFDESHEPPAHHAAALAMDLSGLVASPDLDARAFLRGLIVRSNSAMEELLAQAAAPYPAPSGPPDEPGLDSHRASH